MAAPQYAVGTVTTRLTVTVPQGINGGDLVRVAAPDGSYHSIMVPGGLAAYEPQFQVIDGELRRLMYADQRQFSWARVYTADVKKSYAKPILQDVGF